MAYKSVAYGFNSCCCCLVKKSFPALCHPMDCSMPGSPVLHYLLEFAQTHVHGVDDAIQPSHLRNRISYISCTGRRILYRCTTCLGISCGEAGVLIFFVFPMVLCINDYIQHRVLPAIVLPLRSPFPGWAQALEPFLDPVSPRS